MIAGAVADGVPIFEQAYFIERKGLSIAEPNPLPSVPLVET